MRLDVTGAHQHHQLDHLIHLVAHLEQVEFGDATGIEELPRGDWWIFSPSYYDRIHRMMHPEVAIAWETAGYIQKRSADGPLHGRYSGV